MGIYINIEESQHVSAGCFAFGLRNPKFSRWVLTVLAIKLLRSLIQYGLYVNSYLIIIKSTGIKYIYCPVLFLFIIFYLLVKLRSSLTYLFLFVNRRYDMTKEIYLLEEKLKDLKSLRRLMISNNLDSISIKDLNLQIESTESNLRFLWQEEYDRVTEDFVQYDEEG
jgi:hypothetical protein